ncbi:MAG: HAD-IG family 5'-nucleotidase [Deltaproteobacteria bacterium]|nr:HAD-IG family 5'-nucleotidase [Deltaproteobacteria bacterium]
MLPEQLELPWFDPKAARTPSIPAARRIYVNRDLRLARCDWIGFDMDYTLAIYRQSAMDRLSVRATVDKLVARGYPDWLRTLEFPLDFPIRGLHIDKLLGNVLKMDRFKAVKKGYHGRRELTRNELRALYDEKKLRHKSPRYHWIDTLYALSEVAVYVATIEAYEARGQHPRFGKLWSDIRECIDEAHRDGTILHAIAADFSSFIVRDPELPVALHKLRSAGKRLFVLTNSRWPYTEKLLSYLLSDGPVGYASFHDYFDAIVVAAKKPAFFQETAPLLERLADGTTKRAALPLERGKVYEGGNLHELQAALGPGHRVLYVGDHIYGDILRSKKDTTWRTALVLQELEDEIAAHDRGRDDAAVLLEVQQRHAELEDALRHLQLRAFDLAAAIGKGDASARARDDLTRMKSLLGSVRRQLRNLDRDARSLRRQVDQRFHPYWGSLLKEGGELSLFGAQVDEYACVYTSRVSNLLPYSPHQHFRSPHNQMHHEL